MDTSSGNMNICTIHLLDVEIFQSKGNFDLTVELEKNHCIANINGSHALGTMAVLISFCTKEVEWPTERLMPSLDECHSFKRCSLIWRFLWTACLRYCSQISCRCLDELRSVDYKGHNIWLTFEFLMICQNTVPVERVWPLQFSKKIIQKSWKTLIQFTEFLIWYYYK